MDKVKSPLLKNKQNYAGLAMTGLYTVALTASTAMVTSFAADDLGSKITDAMKTIYSSISGAFDAAAIVAVAICLFLLLFGRSDKTAEKSYSWLFKIVAAFVIFHSLGWFVPWILDTIGHQDYSLMISPLQFNMIL